ncbi:hypothetical protein [Bacillus infantis]|uniref:hypothetical protein n=1 Tax=Bacillus infantis TaxID=324767 RepID=UPI00209EFC7C|nr:hypothetical protein [Bacillus infantis]MCP1159453.1 hypothetical protein [Bacillus infantis]
MIDKGYSKFTKHVSRNRFASFHEWASLSFPEFADEWTIKDFHDFVAYDGSICDSLEELNIYEFIKKDLGISNIKSIGTLYSGEHIFTLPKNHVDNWYCPDFVIEGEKNIYIEYFGLYVEECEKNKENKFLSGYREKTKRKIEFYNSLDHTFIYIYPSDIKPNMNGLINKIKNGI